MAKLSKRLYSNLELSFKELMRVCTVLLMLSCLSACGIKGALELPNEEDGKVIQK